MNLFGKKKKAAPVNLSESINSLRDAMTQMEKREAHLEKQMTNCVKSAKQKSKAGDKRGALFQLKRKKMFEKQINQMYGKRVNLETQIMALESAAGNREIISAMRVGQRALQQTVNENDVDEVEDVVDSINEAVGMVDEIGDAIAQPIGGDVLDDEDLEAELEELDAEAMDEQLLSAPEPIPGQGVRDSDLAGFDDINVPSGPIRAKPQREETAAEKEERELRELEEAMI